MAIYRATFQYFKTDDSTFAQNVLYFENPDNALSLDQIGAALDTQWFESMRPFLTNVVKLETIFLKRVDSTPPSATFPYACRGVAGNLGFNVLHQVLGPIFQLFDGLGGPKHRGRFYPYGVTTADLLRNGPAPSMVTKFNNFKTAIVPVFFSGGSSGLTLLLHHRGTGGGQTTYTNVTDMRLAPRLGVQRRRNFGVGL